jgi:trehalose 6-phosphate synthase complex regulatory subunit
MDDSRNTVFVMSGRTPEELEQLFRLVPNLGLIAENGCFIKGCGQSKWTEMADREKVASWKESVKDILQYYLERTAGSEIEDRRCSLIFHYKNAEDFANAERQASDWTGHINESCEKQRVHATQLEDCVIAEPIDWTKDIAAAKIYDEQTSKQGPFDFLMVVGDGREDEKVFRWANNLHSESAVKDVVTVSLGNRNTEASATLTQGVSGKWHSFTLGRAAMMLTCLGVLVALQKLASLS